jgi:hypothetical protein
MKPCNYGYNENETTLKLSSTIFFQSKNLTNNEEFFDNIELVKSKRNKMSLQILRNKRSTIPRDKTFGCLENDFGKPRQKSKRLLNPSHRAPATFSPGKQMTHT